jgi:predicted nucleic acid-binding protein
MYYLDTSVLVSLYIAEVYSIPNLSFASENHHSLHISTWTITELYSALNRKVRVDGVPLSIIRKALKIFAEQQSVYAILSLEDASFAHSQTFLSSKRFKLSLGAGEALHLACCFENQLELVTCDERMHDAAKALRLKSMLIR